LLGFAQAPSVVPVLTHSTGRRGAYADREPEPGPASSDHGFAAAGANDDAATRQWYRPRQVVRMDDSCQLGRLDIVRIALRGLSAGEPSMDQRTPVAIALFGMVLVAVFVAVISATAIQPLSMRLAALLTEQIAAQSDCGGTRANETTGLTCLLYRAASARR